MAIVSFFVPAVHPGNHDLLGKDVVITSTHGPIITILIGITAQQSVISIDKGKLDGVCIQNGTVSVVVVYGLAAQLLLPTVS